MLNSGETGKREGMAARSADPHWWQCMLESAKAVAERKPYFNVDDLVTWMHRHYPNASTHELRASGPLMSNVARLGYGVPTEDFRPSRQRDCHATPRLTWVSLIYQGDSARVPKPRKHRPRDSRQYDMLE